MAITGGYTHNPGCLLQTKRNIFMTITITENKKAGEGCPSPAFVSSFFDSLQNISLQPFSLLLSKLEAE